jgi:hypothetical protein
VHLASAREQSCDGIALMQALVRPMKQRFVERLFPVCSPESLNPPPFQHKTAAITALLHQSGRLAQLGAISGLAGAVLLPLRRSERDDVVCEGLVDLLEGADIAVAVELPDQLAAVLVS